MTKSRNRSARLKGMSAAGPWILTGGIAIVVSRLVIEWFRISGGSSSGTDAAMSVWLVVAPVVVSVSLVLGLLGCRSRASLERSCLAGAVRGWLVVLLRRRGRRCSSGS
jgi:hypothetical protein